MSGRWHFIGGLLIGGYLGMEITQYTYWHRQWYRGFFEGLAAAVVVLTVWYLFAKREDK